MPQCCSLFSFLLINSITRTGWSWPQTKTGQGQRSQSSAGLGDLDAGCHHPFVRKRGDVYVRVQTLWSCLLPLQNIQEKQADTSGNFKSSLKVEPWQELPGPSFPFRILPMTSEYDKAQFLSRRFMIMKWSRLSGYQNFIESRPLSFSSRSLICIQVQPQRTRAASAPQAASLLLTDTWLSLLAQITNASFKINK